MKRERTKGFISGVLTSLLLVVLVVTAVAQTGTIQKTLEYKNISVTLDGKKLDLKDAKGNPVEPFMFDGTNYLPVRAISEALGLNVAWDGSSNTVVLKTPGSASTTPTQTNTDGLIVDKENIKIYYHGISTSDSYMGGYGIKLKIVNDSNRDVMIQVRNLSVNGIMTDSIFSCDIAAGKTAIDEITLYQSALDKNYITTIDNASFKFIALDGDTWDTIFETSEITVSK
ncbi:copper amine oxidase N-terminal domain-containing protein [Oscillibacter sp. MSJ-2]|uniref:Copper amine oxidase N-terminal domain-containing protein n=1 Tax=Dysosmobacter acutus TaxID=2841504 RepID=A0ABS6FBW5_9FIRM|nr:stalk domain-containing protein [Dysosmobacter acutus]MBU5627751.1 copper amine oxidase N-terminal domain-containing protein [Dysosmobacter acutus]